MKKIFAVAILMMAFSVFASADAVSVGDGWHVFNFDGAGSAGDHNPFTFTAAGPVHITVQDGFQAGDRFSVYDGATLLGYTSVPTGFGDQCFGDLSGPGAGCIGDALWSSGIFNLGAGSYSINIFAVDSPFGLGSAYFRVDRGTVPEPGTLALLGTGLLGFGFRRRRKI